MYKQHLLQWLPKEGKRGGDKKPKQNTTHGYSIPAPTKEKSYAMLKV